MGNSLNTEMVADIVLFLNCEQTELACAPILNQNDYKLYLTLTYILSANTTKLNLDNPTIFMHYVLGEI